MTATAVSGTRLSDGSTVRRVFPDKKKKKNGTVALRSQKLMEEPQLFLYPNLFHICL